MLSYRDKSADKKRWCGEFRRVLFRSQAEDGIRDDLVTGVQTCALPIFFARLGNWKLRHVKRFALQDLPGPLAVALRQGHTRQDSEPEQGQPRAGTSKIQAWNQFEGLLRRGLRFLQAIPLIQ